MKRKEGSTPVRRANATVLTFLSRAEQVRLRGQRNYSRYMFVVKGFVDPDGPERRQWQKEAAEDSVRDAEWNHRHGPVPEGARILQWHVEGHTEWQGRPVTPTAGTIR